MYLQCVIYEEQLGLKFLNRRPTAPSHCSRLANLHSRSSMAIFPTLCHLRSTTIPPLLLWTSSKLGCFTISKHRTQSLRPRQNNRNAPIDHASIQQPP